MDSLVGCPPGEEPAVGRDGATIVNDPQHRSQGREVGSSSRKLRCPQCESGYLVIQQCKAICENCGYVESSEDNFVPNQDNPAEETVGSG